MSKGEKNPASVSKAEAKRRFAALEKSKTPQRPMGRVVVASKILGDISPSALSRWLISNGVTVGHIGAKQTKEQCIDGLKKLVEAFGHMPSRTEIHWSEIGDSWRTHWRTLQAFIEEAGLANRVDRALIVRLLRSAPTLDYLAMRAGMTRGQALDYCDTLKAEGLNILVRGERISLESVPTPILFDENLHVYTSDKQGRYRFGIVSDNHLGSKYAREDVLHDLYDWFAREGITRVYNAGNWIDGEARFNRHDLLVHGMDAQLKYFAQRYPQREGMVTYYIAGDDHEGWYAKDTGVDIGKAAQKMAESMQRRDLRYLGYMEAYIRLRHAVTGAESQLMVVHPGGGSSYAISYAPQKFIEALQGGEKPAVVIFGHWHKMDVFDYRNVWSIQAGTTEDQTPFMRKKKLEAHVGGMIVELEQDTRGAITMCVPRMKRYFDRGYYNGSFNMADDITRDRNVMA